MKFFRTIKRILFIEVPGEFVFWGVMVPAMMSVSYFVGWYKGYMS